MQSDPTSHQTSQNPRSQSEMMNGSQKTSEVDQPHVVSAGSKRPFLSRVRRRSFLGRAGLFTAASVVAGVTGSPLSSKRGEDAVQAMNIGSFNHADFRKKAYQVRVAAAQANQQIAIPQHPTNGDEERYPNKIATDTRGLPHDKLGEVKLDAYNSLIAALTSGDPSAFENIIMGGDRKLINPQGPMAVSLEGCNACQVAVPPAPTLNSAEQAGEAVELYWQALLRDVPFSEFHDNTNHPDVLTAVEELNKLSAFRGPKQNGRITPQSLFRGSVTYVDRQTDPSGKTGKHFIPPGVTDGPYISQFLLLNVPTGTQYISPLIRVPLPSNDFLTDFDEWLTVQNGGSSGKSTKFDSTRRYIFNGRDLAELAHNTWTLFLGASLILGTKPDSSDIYSGGIGAPLNPGNPYVKSRTKMGSAATFAVPYLQGLLPLATSRAIRASYWQKWYVHRRLRPEAYGGLIYNNIVNKTQYPIHSDVLNSQALARTFSNYGTYLLPQAYPESAPLHPAYTGGAAAIAGVNATLLKAFFDENFVIPNPVVPDPKDPTKLIPYSGPPLTVGGELNKLAINYTLGSNSAGIHWRSDAAVALALGEEVAISLLKDEKLTFNEKFTGYTLTKFDGSKITV